MLQIAWKKLGPKGTKPTFIFSHKCISRVEKQREMLVVITVLLGVVGERSNRCNLEENLTHSYVHPQATSRSDLSPMAVHSEARSLGHASASTNAQAGGLAASSSPCEVLWL